MFHSARLKLTLFYLGAILVLSLSLTLIFRSLAQREFDRSNTALLGIYQISVAQGIIPRQFEDFQLNQQELVNQRLNQYVLYINALALIVGGAASYWFAGRTLKPIEKAHDAQKRFASDASHELKTPLAAMQLENEVFLRQKNFTSGKARELIKSNIEEVQRLESLATQLLALTQYENAQIELKRIKVAVVVKQAIAQTKKVREDKKITVKQQIKPGNIIGHEDSLVQLLSIVLDNAVKYSPKNTTITVSGKKAGEDYALTIQDEGPGIDSADLPHIFDRLYRGDKARSSTTQGYGLGLSLAKQIASVNEAIITAANKKGSGAVFTIRFLT